MADPFTIRIFVPDGDPEGVRIIDRMNWTGLGIVFPRSKWPTTKTRAEFRKTGVYILVGPSEDEDLPLVYIGQTDDLKGRIDAHFTGKDFWDWGVVFISTSGGLNRAHVTWLEHALVDRAAKAERCKLYNANSPGEPALSESEKADTQGFLKEILQILPLVGLRVFEVSQPVATPRVTTQNAAVTAPPTRDVDTIIVPAQLEGFEKVFLGENRWRAIRIGGGMIPKIKYIAGYQTQPVSAITHYALVDHIEPYGDAGKYQLVFSEPAKPIGPIPYGDAPGGAMQGPRYTTLRKLLAAKTLTDLIAKK
jgi:hypothetical protein